MTLVVVHEKNTHAMTLVDPYVDCGRNRHAMTLVVVHEMNRHAMTLVDPYVVCGRNKHAMNLAVVHEKNIHAITLGGSMCGLWKEQTCNDSNCG